MSLDFKAIIDVIKSEHPQEFIAVDQLGDDYIMMNEFNMGASPSGEILKYEDGDNLHNMLHDLIDKQCIVLRDRPIEGIPDGFTCQSTIAFFDIWREGFDGERSEKNMGYCM